MEESEREFLLELAKRSLLAYSRNQPLRISPTEIASKGLLERRATFVTLTENGQLRGCVGHLEPTQPLYQDVAENAVAAAFFDHRFSPVETEEIPILEVEISILTLPQKLVYQNSADLISKLDQVKPGVIIRHGELSATFLPQVWRNLNHPEEFLSQLCVKAGLPPHLWRQKLLTILTYQTETFSGNP